MWRNFKFSEAHRTVVGSASVLQEATLTAKSAAACLALLSARYRTGVTLKAAKLSNNPNDSRQIPISEFISMAAKLGLSAQYICRDWRWVKLETINGPVVLLLKNRNTVVAITGGGDQEIVISDPSYNDGKILTLPHKELERVWDGDAITVVPRPFAPAKQPSPAAPPRRNAINFGGGEVYRIVYNREPQDGLPQKMVPTRRSAKISLFLLSATLVQAVVVVVFVGREPAFDKMHGVSSLRWFYEHLLPAPTEDVTTPAYLGARGVSGAIAVSALPRGSIVSTDSIFPGGRAVSSPISSRAEGATSGGDALPEGQSTDARLGIAARSSKEAVLALRARGDVLFGAGDIVSARLFYERAAEGGDGQAALQLGETYDPEFLKRAGITGIRGDSATAKRWYRQASGLGASEAQILLNSAADR